ncbi:MAG: IMP dehydrogenase [Oligoflexia bacterium]|nr:IMP dehydrogenase [Oligoflexia bacterium]
MANRICFEPSRTLMEFRLLPGFTSEKNSIDKISLKTKLASTKNSTNNSTINLNIPVVSAAMQAVSGVDLSLSLAKEGGLSFIYCSQPIDKQKEMIQKIKAHKAGFVTPKTVSPQMKIEELHKLTIDLGFATFPVVDDKDNTFLGLVGKNDFDISIHANYKVIDRMIAKDKLKIGMNVTSLEEAKAIILEGHQHVLPIVDSKLKLKYLVFRKDINNHLNYPLEVTDSYSRSLVGAAISTHDYKDRAPELISAGVDLLTIDSSDGHSFYQRDTLEWLKNNFPKIPVVAGNIVTYEGFQFLVNAGAKAIKVGMGSGSICITQEQKGTGRGLATAVIEAVRARDDYFKSSGEYIPIIADGGITSDRDIIIALALGADVVMMGRYFARTAESPTETVVINNRVMKPYWGEGSFKARNWREARYHQANFAEGVEGFVEYAGKLKDTLRETISKIKSAMSSAGVSSIEELHTQANLEVMSALSIREGQVHDIYMPQ